MRVAYQYLACLRLMASWTNMMAKCDEGYICEVCGKDVGAITDSDLYLRFVIGQIEAEVLHTTAERHIRCNPPLAQFIVDERFSTVECEGSFSKKDLDKDFVEEREQLVTRGWQRLREIVKLDLPITEYPLPEIIEKACQDGLDSVD